MGQKLSYEKRFEIASRLCQALRALYQDRVVTLSDTRALRLAEDDRDIQSSREKDQLGSHHTYFAASFA